MKHLHALLILLLLAPGTAAIAQLPQLLGAGPNPIHALIEYDDSLFIGGAFGSFDGIPSYYSMTYDGSDFQAHGQLLGGSGFREFAIINDTLWGVGNELSSEDQGTNDHVNSIAYRDNGTWKGHNKYSVNNNRLVNGIVSYEGDLVLGGYFTFPYPSVARHNGVNFVPLGSGLDQGINTIMVYDGALYAGGSFAMSGPAPIPFFAMWDGTAWVEVGGSFDSNVMCMEVWNGDLYVGGNFTTAGGIAASRVARWDGSAWHTVLGGVSRVGNGPCYVNELRATPNGLHIGGRFGLVNEVPGNNLALWDGTTLSPYGELDALDEVQAIGVFRGDIYFSTFRFGLGAIGKLFGPGSVGTNERQEQGAEIQLFPMPTNGTFTVRSDQPFSEVRVYNAMGALVHQEAFTPRTGYIVHLEGPGAFVCELRNRGNHVGRGRVLVRGE